MLNGSFIENGVSKNKSTFNKKYDTEIEPEFSKSVTMCIKKQNEEVSKPTIGWTTGYETLLSDTQSYPFSLCD
jgi:hypothetical protein